jgi:hypothetical protein
MKGFLVYQPAVSSMGTWRRRRWVQKPSCRGLARYEFSSFRMKADVALKS